jgi:hypothetical protein
MQAPNDVNLRFAEYRFEGQDMDVASEYAVLSPQQACNIGFHCYAVDLGTTAMNPCMYCRKPNPFRGASNCITTC